LRRLGIVLGHAVTLRVQIAERGHRAPVTLLGGLAIPRGRFGGGFLHTLAVVARVTEQKLRKRAALFSGFPGPLSRFHVILSYALSEEVHAPERFLRVKIAGVGCDLVQAAGLREIDRNAFAEFV